MVIDKGLKAGALGYMSNIVIGVASTAPAYSLAATLGFVVAVDGVGVHAPAVLIVSFIPMLLIAAAYYYLNRADPDCGTTFTWVTRALGPHLGWLTGWAIVFADVVVMATLAEIAGVYTSCSSAGRSASDSSIAMIVGGDLDHLMTWICYIGIELYAKTQQLLLTDEVLILSSLFDRGACEGLWRQPGRARPTIPPRGSTRSTCRATP